METQVTSWLNEGLRHYSSGDAARALEAWYRDHASFRTDFLLLWATGWTVLRPESEIVFRAFPDLPPRPPWWFEA